MMRYELFTWYLFLQRLLAVAVITAATVFPGFIIVDYFRPTLKRLHTIDAGARIVVILCLCAVCAKVLVMLIENALGWANYGGRRILIDTLVNGLLTGGFTLVFLLHFSSRYQQLLALKRAFDQQLAAQNDLIKARIAPHFFFNTINTLVSLIESSPAKAAELLQHVSALFRASFNGPKEISFEEEVALCQHYLSIEACRLTDKLEVVWRLPDDDMMYDMVITALTLQSVLEQILLSVVEMTTETIYMSIEVTWQYHRVVIEINVQLPSKTLFIKRDLSRQINFEIQTKRLQLNFGKSAYIKSQINQQQMQTTISYPLHDAGL